MAHKSGFVAIIGKPNVGKSTLLNRLLNDKLSIVSAKAQTTRQRIKGILNADEYQIIFSDTPGILEPHYLLQEKMMEFVNASLSDADAVVFVTDLEEAYMDPDFVARLTSITVPLIIVINKSDQSEQNEIGKLVAGWKKAIERGGGKLHSIIPVSAQNDFNTEKIIDAIVSILPESPPYFSKEEISDASLRFFASEIVREKIFMHYQQEIPYASEVEIESFKEKKDLTSITAIIYVERESQKGIIIGKGGTSLKRIGTEARKDLEKFLNRKVFLELLVKVEKDWRKNENKLRRFGYSGASK
jgi:GTP-binding protein Era